MAEHRKPWETREVLFPSAAERRGSRLAAAFHSTAASANRRRLLSRFHLEIHSIPRCSHLFKQVTIIGNSTREGVGKATSPSLLSIARFVLTGNNASAGAVFTTRFHQDSIAWTNCQR